MRLFLSPVSGIQIIAYMVMNIVSAVVASSVMIVAAISAGRENNYHCYGIYLYSLSHGGCIVAAVMKIKYLTLEKREKEPL